MLYAQVTDTLTAVELFSKKTTGVAESPVNIQQLNKNALSKLNSISVADAVKYFSGVIVKDYGGIGGLKTVSVRSLGANHTGIMYDGIMVGDAQGGQVDLGRFSLENIETIKLFNNQPADILLPARTYASAAVLSLSSSSENNNENNPAMRISFKAGSFGFINPAVYLKRRINKNFSHGLNAEYQSAKGDYNYTSYETGNKIRRSNSDIKTYRLEYDASYFVNDSNGIRFKTYYYNSKRGLPGAVILYNAFSNQRLNNENFFTQFSFHKNISSRSRLLVNGKYSADHKYYLDPSYQNNIGKLENEYYQHEIYFSFGYTYKFMPSAAISYASDYFRNSLKRTDQFAQSFPDPARNNFLNNIAIQWKQNYFEINGNLLHTHIAETVARGPSANNLHTLTPALSASVQPFKQLPARLRASYKNIFRAPSFDDLYFTNFGNTSLRPEYAKQYNLGITADFHPASVIQEIIFTADAYYNKVKDQILAVPRQNLFQWTTLNVGKVNIKGLDITLNTSFMQWKEITISSKISYTLQQALDVSDPASLAYKTQLPYTPRHSGSANFNLTFCKVAFSYNVLASSYRYRLGEQISENVVEGWVTHDINVGYRIMNEKNFDYKLIGEVNNLYNLQYDIIKYYPMPRFNYRLGITASLKNK